MQRVQPFKRPLPGLTVIGVPVNHIIRPKVGQQLFWMAGIFEILAVCP